MSSKRYKKLPKKTKELPSEVIEKLIPIIKKFTPFKLTTSCNIPHIFFSFRNISFGNFKFILFVLVILFITLLINTGLIIENWLKVGCCFSKGKNKSYDAPLAVERCLRAISENKVKNTGGTDTVVGCDTICVHSDTPNAIEIIQNLNKAIK